MRYRSILAVLAASWGLAFAGLPVPVAGGLAVSKAYADGSRRTGVYPRGRRAVRVRRVVRRGGYYSYTDRDVINTLLWPPFLYSLTSPVNNPWGQLQSSGGPFDSGFFFDSGIAPYNNAPYPQ